MDAARAAPVRESFRTPRWYAHSFNRGGYYHLARLCAHALSRRRRHALARAVARLVVRRLPVERENVRRNLARVLPAADQPALDAAVAGVFRNFAVCFADLLTINRAPAARLSRYLGEIRGQDHLAAAAASGRGLIVATAHLGNWDLGGRLLAATRELPTHVVLAAEEDAAVGSLLRRNTNGIHFVTRGDPTAALALVSALRRGEAVAVQGDRGTGERGDVRAPFFRAPAAFPLGPFLLARAAGAPVVPAFSVLGEGATYRIFLEPPIWVEPGGEEAGLQAFVTVLERYVTAFPEQWFNFYDVWGAGRA